MTLGEGLYVNVEVFLDTGLFELVGLYSGDGLKMSNCLVVTLGEETAHFLLRPPWVQNSLSWYSCTLEMALKFSETREKRLHSHFPFISCS